MEECRKISYGTIIENIEKIDKLQKDIMCPEVTCDCFYDSLFATKNTIPVCLESVNARFFECFIGCNTDRTPFFRVECVREHRYVTLRALRKSNCNYEVTDSFLILDLNHVCGLECFSPVDLDLYTRENED